VDAEKINHASSVTRPRHQAGRRSSFRTRPRGRSALQEEQSHASRQRILDAAERAFYENSYAATTVEDILQRADIGRATFYRHFGSMFEVARGLIERFKPSIFSFYDELAALRAPTQTQIEGWIRHYLQIYRETRPFMTLLLQVSGAEQEFFPILTDLDAQYMVRLGAGIPAFRMAAEGGPEGRAAATGAQLLLQRLSTFCYLVVLRNWAIDEDEAIRFIARDFARFIDEFDATRETR
jgi:AcrR family transcriptional regulator